MATIIQDYGPIYGEVVNGTVQGRPNGSVYVPISNVITASLIEGFRYILQPNNSTISLCTDAGITSNNQKNGLNMVAIAQDLASNMQVDIYTDAGLTTKLASNSIAAGLFNTHGRIFTLVTSGAGQVENGTTYYLQVSLMNNGTPIAVSDVIEVVGYVSE